jgi:hypothetical protein
MVTVHIPTGKVVELLYPPAAIEILMVDPSSDLLLSWSANSYYAAQLQQLNATSGKTSPVFTASYDLSANGGKLLAHFNALPPFHFNTLHTVPLRSIPDTARCRLCDGCIRWHDLQYGEHSVRARLHASTHPPFPPSHLLAWLPSFWTTLTTTDLTGSFTIQSILAPTPVSSCQSRTGRAIFSSALDKFLLEKGQARCCVRSKKFEVPKYIFE